MPGKNISVDVENNFEPDYVIPDDKKKIVAELRKLAKQAETVWLARMKIVKERLFLGIY